MKKKRTTKTGKRPTPSRARGAKRMRPRTLSKVSVRPGPATTSPPTQGVTPPRTARTYRATAAPAQRRGADLVRYLRIHSKHPYGSRGEEAIRCLAIEVGHLGNAELGSYKEGSVD